MCFILSDTNKIIKLMSVVVASHYIRNLNTGKKEVQFLSNVEVPLPPIPLSKIEKECKTVVEFSLPGCACSEGAQSGGSQTAL